MYKCPVCIENNSSPGIRDYDRIQDVYLAIYLLAMSTTLVNPIVYYSINTKFRQYFHRCAQHLVIYVAHTLILKDTPSILRQRLVKCKMKKKTENTSTLLYTLRNVLDPWADYIWNKLFNSIRAWFVIIHMSLNIQQIKNKLVDIRSVTFTVPSAVTCHVCHVCNVPRV